MAVHIEQNLHLLRDSTLRYSARSTWCTENKCRNTTKDLFLSRLLGRFVHSKPGGSQARQNQRRSINKNILFKYAVTRVRPDTNQSIHRDGESNSHPSGTAWEIQRHEGEDFRASNRGGIDA